jgi:ABC-2 type transport system permease protein
MRKEFRQIRRDSRSLIFMIFIPAFLLIMFGFALNFDVKHIPLRRPRGSREPRARREVRTTEYFDIKAVPGAGYRRPDGPEKIKAALVIPATFSEDLLAGRSPSVQFLLDGANAMSGTTAAGYAAAILQSYSQRTTLEALERRGAGGVMLPLATEVRVWYNPSRHVLRGSWPILMAP